MRYGCAVWDELLRVPLDGVPRLSQDAASHEGGLSAWVVRELIRRYEPVFQVTDGTVEPGDAIIVGPRSEAHLYVVGTRPNTMWHASPPSVQWTGMSTPMPVISVYRFHRKLERWA